MSLAERRGRVAVAVDPEANEDLSLVTIVRRDPALSCRQTPDRKTAGLLSQFRHAAITTPDQDGPLKE
jgi:hypothetical protein